MRVLEKSAVRRASAEDVDAYIEKVMRELIYPFFLRRKIRKRLRDFLYREFGLDAALSEMPADQLSFRIGNPRDVAQDFAATCRYVWLRGKMPVWKKGLIAAILAVVILLAAFFAVHIYNLLNFDHGDWRNKAWNADIYDSSNYPHSNVKRY